jgi:hypothetical protein
MAENPIKHSEIVQQGNPAKDAIKGLQDLELQFTKTKKTLEGGIPGMLARGNGANPASKGGQDEIKALQKDVEKLIRANKLLEDQINKLKTAKKGLSGVDKEINANEQRELTLKNKLIAAEQLYGAASAKTMMARKNLMTFQRDSVGLTAAEERELRKLNTTLIKHDEKVNVHNRKVGDYMNSMKGVILQYASWTAAGYALISMFKKAIQGAMDDERQERKLMFAVNQNAAQYNKLIEIKKKYQSITIFSEEEIYNALNVATALGRSAEETDKMLRVASALANVMGTDLDTAMTQLSATFEGSKGRLAKYNGEISNLTEEQLKAGMAVDLLDEKIGKFATVGLDTASGKLKIFQNNWDEFLDTMGAKTLPVLSFVLDGFNKLLGPSYKQKFITEGMAEADARLAKSLEAINDKSKTTIADAPKKEVAIKKETAAVKDLTKAWEDYMKAVHAPATMKMGELYGTPQISNMQGAGAGQIPTSGPSAPTKTTAQSAPNVGQGDPWAAFYEQLDKALMYMNNVGGEIQNLLGSISAMFQQQMQNEMNLVEDRFLAEEMLLAKSFDNKVISEQQYNSKKAVLEKKKKEQEIKIQKEYAKKQQKIQLVQAIVGTAMAVVNALQTVPFMPLGLLMAILAGAAGAVQIATIAGQEFAEGGHGMLGEKQQGRLKGKRHSQGGVNLGAIGTAEQGEYFGIVNRAATQKYGDDLGVIFDALNQRKFERMFSPRTPQVNVTVDNKWSKKLYEQAVKPMSQTTVTDKYIIIREGNYTQKINKN